MIERGGSTTARLIPVGHYLGPLFPGGDAPPSGYRLRLGSSTVEVLEPAIRAWILTHQEPAEASEPWSRTSLAAATTGEAVDTLFVAGLLVEVQVGSGDAVAFAKAHRLRGLMLCVGRDPDAPDVTLLGLPGEPAVALSWAGYQTWHHGHRAPNLWTACAAIAATRADPVTPAGVLREMLGGGLGDLLACGAAYLDAAGVEAGTRVDTAGALAA
jgi:hypothetical protein